jgi:hypothetical protein
MLRASGLARCKILLRVFSKQRAHSVISDTYRTNVTCLYIVVRLWIPSRAEATISNLAGVFLLLCCCVSASVQYKLTVHVSGGPVALSAARHG